MFKFWNAIQLLQITFSKYGVQCLKNEVIYSMNGLSFDLRSEVMKQSNDLASRKINVKENNKISEDYEMLIYDNNDFNQFYGEIFISDIANKYYTKFDTASSKVMIYDVYDEQDSEDEQGQSSKPQTKQVNDMICLEKKIVIEDLKKKNYGLCVQSYEILYYKTDDKLEAVLGLAPSKNGNALVQQLKKNGLKRGVIGINFQVPHQSTIQSTITFGMVQFDKVVDRNIVLFSNVGRDLWGFLIEDILYDDQDMSKDQGPRIAILDSINSNIQLPEKVWWSVFKEMQKLTKHNIQILEDVDQENGQVLMKANKHCEDIHQYLKPFQFQLEKTIISINPVGYTFMVSDSQKFCQIAFQRLPQGMNTYGLGSQFLKSFYVVLDYEKDQIGLGLNLNLNKGPIRYADFQSSKKKASQKDFDAPEEYEGTIILIALVLYCFFYYFYRFLMKRWKIKREELKKKKEEEKKQKEEEEINQIQSIEQNILISEDKTEDSIKIDDQINENQINLIQKSQSTSINS